MKKAVLTLGKIHKYINQYTVAVDVNNKVECTIYGVDYIVTREGRKYTLYIGDMNNQVFVSTTQKAMVEELDRLISSKKTKKATTKKVEEKSNKELVEDTLKKEGLVLGCWDRRIENLNSRNLSKILNEIPYWSATEVKVKRGLKDYVVTIDFVDNEVDFTLYSKEEYLSMFDTDLFEREEY